MLKMNAAELRTSPVDPEIAKSLPKNPVTIIVDNVLDTYNVGSIFRLADAVASAKVYLCGATLTPPNTRIKKASINTWEWVNWEYAETTQAAIEKFRTDYPEGKVIAVEQAENSKPFNEVQYTLPTAIIVGNETYGVSKEVLGMVDTIVELPMWGINKSLNVMVSLGIVLYKIMEKRLS